MVMSEEMRDKKRLNNKKGFTLAELLIIAAIVGVLVAVSIPIFQKNLERTRETVDIQTMRTAASAAVDLYYAGIDTKKKAEAAGLSWNDSGDKEQVNAYGAYDPKTGKIYKNRPSLPASSKTYGKGTRTNGGTEYIMGKIEGAYNPEMDYTKAVIVISIFPKSANPHVDVYWKYNKTDNSVGAKEGDYVGGKESNNIPKYCIRIYLN